jgi:hypothetical protein
MLMFQQLAERSYSENIRNLAKYFMEEPPPAPIEPPAPKPKPVAPKPRRAAVKVEEPADKPAAPVAYVPIARRVQPAVKIPEAFPILPLDRGSTNDSDDEGDIELLLMSLL